MEITDYPKISISVPSYNHKDFLADCLDSIIAQEYPNLELIVMDDGSTDGSVDVIKKREKHITYWQSEPNQGVIAMTGGGFKKSTGDIMMSLSSTDLLHQHALYNVYKLFSFPNVSWVMGAVSWLKDERLEVFPYLRLWSRARFLNQQAKGLCCISTEGTFFHRSLWEKAGAYIADCPAWDFELYTRFFRYSLVHTTTAILGIYRIHGNRVFDESVYEDSAYRIAQEELKQRPITQEDIVIAEPLIAPRGNAFDMGCDPPQRS